MSMLAAGLYVVATPIGNLEDISARALNILRHVDLILAEDTRHSSRLLQHYGINTPVQSLHDHNESRQLPVLLDQLRTGRTLALITDAGTPLINDPGYPLVRAAHAEGIRLIPVPGPSALICALSVSGLPTDRFAYEGFLPPKRAARRKRLMELAAEPRTLVFYEVPHRIYASVEDMIECFGPDRMATLAKELTKHFETIYKHTLAGILDWLGADPLRQKGEFVLVVEGLPAGKSSEVESTRVLKALLPVLPLKEAVALAATLLNENRNQMYKLAISIKGR